MTKTEERASVRAQMRRKYYKHERRKLEPYRRVDGEVSHITLGECAVTRTAEGRVYLRHAVTGRTVEVRTDSSGALRLWTRG